VEGAAGKTPALQVEGKTAVGAKVGRFGSLGQKDKTPTSQAGDQV